MILIIDCLHRISDETEILRFECATEEEANAILIQKRIGYSASSGEYPWDRFPLLLGEERNLSDRLDVSLLEEKK